MAVSSKFGYCQRGPTLQCEEVTFEGIQLSQGDIDRCQPYVFLNDNVVDFYLAYLTHRRGGLSDRVSLPNSSFSRLLRRNAKQCSQRWLRHQTGILDKDLMCVPVCDKKHWTCLVAFNLAALLPVFDAVVPRFAATEPTGGTTTDSGAITLDEEDKGEVGSDVTLPPECGIFILDSNDQSDRPGVPNEVVQGFKDFVAYRYGVERSVGDGTNSLRAIQNIARRIPVRPMRIPQQANDCDCGVYVLHCIELLTLPPVLKSLLANYQPHASHTDWFGVEAILQKRTFLSQLILSLDTCLKEQRDNPSASDTPVPPGKSDVHLKPDSEVMTRIQAEVAQYEEKMEGAGAPTSGPNPNNRRAKRRKKGKGGGVADDEPVEQQQPGPTMTPEEAQQAAADWAQYIKYYQAQQGGAVDAGTHNQHGGTQDDEDDEEDEEGDYDDRGVWTPAAPGEGGRQRRKRKRRR